MLATVRERVLPWRDRAPRTLGGRALFRRAPRLPAAVRLLPHRRPADAPSRSRASRGPPLRPPPLPLVLELPRVAPPPVRIVAVDTTLVVSGLRERPHPTAARYHQVEIEYGPFERRIELAEDVDPAGARPPPQA